jgi:hypothetical protein
MTIPSHWGELPDRQALAACLAELSQRYYDGRYMPGRTLFDEQRPPGWRQALAIQRSYGQPQTSEGWRRLLADLGFTAPVAPPGIGLAVWRRQWQRTQALDAPLVEEEKLAVHLPRPEGLPVIARQRPVRAWCPRRHRYVVVGRRQVWEVR